MGVLGYLFKRLLLMIPVLFVVSLITFALTTAIPADPIALYIGEDSTITPEQEAILREKLGLDEPIPVRYYLWLTRVLQGDLGTSFKTKKPVLEDITIHFARSLELIHLALFLTLALGIPIGVFSAVKRDSTWDFITRVISLAGTAAPIFWVALLLQLFFYSFSGLLPLRGYIDLWVSLDYPIQRITGMPLLDSLVTVNLPAFLSVLQHMILPAVALMMNSLARVMRQTRSCMLDVLEQDYIRTARAQGLPERLIVFKYALKNALIPVVTVIGLTYGFLLTGTFLVEAVFDYPGMGSYSVYAFLAVDYPAILGVSLLATFIFVVVNLIVDVVYHAVDPRIEM